MWTSLLSPGWVGGHSLPVLATSRVGCMRDCIIWEDNTIITGDVIIPVGLDKKRIIRRILSILVVCLDCEDRSELFRHWRDRAL